MRLWKALELCLFKAFNSDGLWYAVSLEVNGNYTISVLDQVHPATGTDPGALKIFNLESQPCVFWRSYLPARHKAWKSLKLVMISVFVWIPLI